MRWNLTITDSKGYVIAGISDKADDITIPEIERKAEYRKFQDKMFYQFRSHNRIVVRANIDMNCCNESDYQRILDFLILVSYDFTPRQLHIYRWVSLCAFHNGKIFRNRVFTNNLKASIRHFKILYKLPFWTAITAEQWN